MRNTSKKKSYPVTNSLNNRIKHLIWIRLHSYHFFFIKWFNYAFAWNLPQFRSCAVLYKHCKVLTRFLQNLLKSPAILIQNNSNIFIKKRNKTWIKRNKDETNVTYSFKDSPKKIWKLRNKVEIFSYNSLVGVEMSPV